jgi:predicted lipid-binding transport protein (Tim44 family)
MKKFMKLFLAIALVFTVGSAMSADLASAKGKRSYNSGVKNFQQQNNQNTNISKQDSNTVNSPAKNTAPTKATSTKSKGGFMKGLLFGGLAGLLLGSLLGNLGALGAILGLLINVLVIVMAIALIRKIYVHFKNKKKEKEANVWRN